ncbi:GAF and ANTAR domain-containing protein [Pseudarthrobacter sp. NamE2]|uniref:GAF and ANTAR domain-containing protein n=1 Tax=Pseudarthrobacter sp. NamE2 TaxID=2576838 RepID=UPI0014858769|nr:GAF and ANTAR domain-containing protein [Pseudarthrobacter sp. NamE2]
MPGRGTVRETETRDAASDLVGAASPDVLLDIRADTSEASLTLLAQAAAAEVAEVAGCALDCTVSLPRPKRRPLTVGTSDSALALAQVDQDSGHGPVTQALAGNPAVIANNYSAEPRWPNYWRFLQEAGYRSIASVPLTLEPGCSGALTLMAGGDDVFTGSVLTALTDFGDRAGRSYVMAEEFRTTRAAADQLHAALESRTMIDAACGVIMAQSRCSYEEAFQIIAKASSHRNIKVRVIAETILANVPGGPASTRFQS